jgi:hypothetical protein
MIPPPGLGGYRDHISSVSGDDMATLVAVLLMLTIGLGLALMAATRRL